MNYQRYISLIKELEVYARTHPVVYRYRVAFLAFLGYAYIIGLIVLLLSFPLLVLIGLIVNFKAVSGLLFTLVRVLWLLIPLGVAYISILGGIFKAFAVKVPDPQGREISQKDAPLLYEFINDTCKKLKASQPKKILITDEFNAAIVTLPRFGMFGRRVQLLLGLPLMQALSPEQFRAVITHEIGHISGRHGTFAKWAYQLQESWSRIFESQMAHENTAAFLYDKFVKWFFPYFGAYAFVLMRGHEREADSYAVQYVGAKPLGEALLALRAKNSMLAEVFWRNIERENAIHEAPTPAMFSRMLVSFQSTDAELDRATVEKAVTIPTDYADTHPSLAERLKLMGYWNGEGLPPLPEAITESAAQFYLGGLVPELTAKFDEEWQERAKAGWKERYEYYQKTSERFGELSAKDELTADELYEKAALVAEKQSRSDAIPLLRDLLARYPDHAQAMFALGVLLLEQDDESGFDLLKQAVELDGKLHVHANDAAFQYLRGKGRFEEAAPYAEALEQYNEELIHAEKERKGIFLSDNIIPHKLSEEDLEGLKKTLGFHEEIIEAFVVSKEVKYFSDIPYHGLFIILDLKRSKTSGIAAQDIVDTLAKNIGDFNVNFVYCFDPKQNKKGIERLSQVEGAKVYSVK